MKWTKYQKKACGNKTPFWKKENYKKSVNYNAYKNRKKELGFYPFEVWNLDYTIAFFILPRLVYYRDIHPGAPDCYTEEEWNNKLDSYIEAFQKYLDDDYDDETREKMWNKIKPILHDFIDNLPCLWT